MDEQQVYERFCKDRFQTIENKQDKLSEDMEQVSRKVFNGYNSAIENLKIEVKTLRGWIMGLIGTMGMSLLATMVKMIWFT